MEAQDRSISAFLPAYSASLGSKSHSTQANYLRYAKVLAEFFISTPVNQITAEEVNKSYYLHLKGKYSDPTIQLYFEGAGKFFDWLSESGLECVSSADLLTDKIRASLKEYHRNYQGDLLSEVEIKIIRDHIRSTTSLNNPIQLRNALMVEILAQSGPSVSELVKICIEDIRLSTNTIRIRGDDNLERLVGFKYSDGRIRRYLERYELVKEGKNRELFANTNKIDYQVISVPLTERSVQRIVKNIAADSGIKKQVSPMVFRNSLLVYWRKHENANYLEVNELMGNSTTNMHYQRFDPIIRADLGIDSSFIEYDRAVLRFGLDRYRTYAAVTGGEVDAIRYGARLYLKKRSLEAWLARTRY